MFSESYGGPTTTFIRNTINSLLDSHHEVIYVCSLFIPGNEIQHPNFSISVLPKELSLKQRILFRINRNEYSSLYLKRRELNKKYKQILEDFQPDIIHCQFFNEALWLLENINLEEKKIICQFHGYDASKLLTNSSYRRLIRKYNKKKEIHFFFVAQSLKRNVENAINVEIRQSSILRCGIDTELFNDPFPNKTSKIKDLDLIKFLQISSLTEKKGHEYTLAALAKFKSFMPEIKFQYTICGEGPLKNKLQDKVKDLNLEKEVVFSGKINPEQAKQYLLTSNVFIHHSITSKEGDQEGIPTAIMEAMAMGLPILSTKHSGITELIMNNTIGVLVEEKNIKEILNSIELIMDYKTYVYESVEVINEEFSLKNHRRELNNQYSKILMNSYDSSVNQV
jgi:colanic acid/amylovoran biosynthesis glycosyltransferase